MLNLKSIHGHPTIIPLLLFADIVAADINNSTDTTTNSTSSCTPSGCVAICTPNCSIEEACVLRTMTNCGVCPASTCVSRSILGLLPIATSNSTTNQSNSSSDGGLIGGIVGGLAGLGIILGLGVYCYIKRGKKKGKLPFAFTSGTAGNAAHIMSQEKFQNSPPPTPNPAVIAALTLQQQRSEPSRYIGMTGMASSISSTPSPTSTISSTTQKLSTINSVPSPHRFNSINTPLYNNNNENNTIYNENNTFNNNFINVPTPTSTIITSPTNNTTTTNANIPEEFEERIALQNKRISQILNSNPRLSRSASPSSATIPPPQPPLPQQYHKSNRNSIMSYTTDDDSEFDDDDRNSVISSPIRKTTISRSQYQPQLASSSAQAIQVTRAKVQIMRVNSVRTNAEGSSNNNSDGLSRSGSVRTVLTAVTPPIPPPSSPIDEEDDQYINISTDLFPSTPNNRSFATEDPFIDTPANTSHDHKITEDYWNRK